ncbi:hypothetical protein TNCV_449881 [Trichonephila clavipes]|nr:hypothetical protein TNCV_449881 [Trichonephila clavipes]
MRFWGPLESLAPPQCEACEGVRYATGISPSTRRVFSGNKAGTQDGSSTNSCPWWSLRQLKNSSGFR